MLARATMGGSYILVNTVLSYVKVTWLIPLSKDANRLSVHISMFKYE